MNASNIKFEIENIVKSNKSYATKRKELATRLGLRPFEINLVLPAEARNAVVNPRFTFKFGIELEMLAQASAVRMAIENQGCSCSGMLGYHHTNGNSRFELKRDGSIVTDRNTAAGNDGVECVSGIMNGNADLKTIEKVVKSIDATGAQVNMSTGYHVHISTPNMTDAWYCNVFVNYAYAEKVIDSFMAPSRRANVNSYCFSLRDSLSELKAAKTISEVQEALGNSRYYKVNPMAYTSHSTLEFRQHQGTLNATKVVNWVKFCSALVAWSKTHRLDHELTSVDEMSWLTKALKDYYKSRQAEFAARVAA